MLRTSVIACALIASATCAARPMVIRESQALEPPPGSNYQNFAYEVGVDGDWAILTAGTPSPAQNDPPQRHDALLYHRVNGQWTLDHTLVSRLITDTTQYVGFRSVAMNNGVAAIGVNPIRIYKRTNNTWAEIAHPFASPPNNPAFVDGELVWDGNTLLAGQQVCYYQSGQPWGASLARLNGDGSWSPVERVSSGDVSCAQLPSHWGISGNTVVAGAWSTDYELNGPDQMRIFRRSGTTWTPTSSIEGGRGQGDVRGDEIFFSSDGPGGTLVYRNDDTQTVTDNVRTVSAATQSGGVTYGFRHTADLFVQNHDVYRKNVAGKYEHVATLIPSGPYYLEDRVALSGRRLISNARRTDIVSSPAALIFDLPATLTPSAVIATGFGSGQSPFNPQLGAFAVVSTATGNRVYRQSSLTGDHRALLGNSDWADQSIEADIKPTTFSGADRWAGLAVRYLDSSNYYYVTLRSSGVVALKAVRSGVVSTLVQNALPIVAGRSYHVSLQATGPRLVLRVDGVEFLWWQDGQPIPHGSAALLGYRTAVDYDNVVAAEVGQRPIFDLPSANCYGPLVYTPAWTANGTGSWNCSRDTGVKIMQQTSTAGDARALAGTPTDDQVVTTRARMTRSDGGQDRWFGIAARYADTANYYYVTVRTSNTVSLRKVVNGTITVLGTVALPVAANTWYDLRLDAVGNELRAFVNGVQVLQAVDTSHATGQGGILTYKAAAEYSNYLAWQP